MEREWTRTDVKGLLSRHRRYFDTKATRAVDFRLRQLKALKQGLKKHEEALCEALKNDLGKHSSESYMTEVGFLYASLSNAINHLKKWDRPQRKQTPLFLMPARSYAVREPYGTVLILGAYNYPVQLLLEPLIGAIAAGNTAVLKTSELAAHTAAALRQMIEDTFETDYVTCLEGGPETGDALVHSAFDYIFFTGSESVGRKVLQAAAENLVPVTLELGGKSPVIVDESANLKAAARRIVWGKLLNAGQTCVAPDYVLVHQSVEEKLLEQMKKAVRKYYGKNVEKSRDYGRIIDRRQFQRISKLIALEKDSLFFGGGSNPQTLYIEPTILRLAGWDHPVMEEEIFGPVLPVIAYGELEGAISRIQQRPKPLALYLFTRRKKVEKKVIKELSSGGACINDTILHLANHWLPFGGVGRSGMGSYHGQQSFHTFSHEKGVLKKPASLNNTLAYPPFTKGKLWLVKRFLR
ncbi:aldehyde dehydrogenase [Aminipila butyrica]|uniref:Aldehyde dehydrogenase n=1 Tax=Aminipila butyrica TaxID=433296 RepID=A0A858BXB0_9FIRM|nr:aldehyde dehydrogenase [Aminipila butyrica]QIB69748.1 aldehyde dehydrogenase [Aminipila butyrica]